MAEASRKLRELAMDDLGALEIELPKHILEFLVQRDHESRIAALDKQLAHRCSSSLHKPPPRLSDCRLGDVP
jgi:hypothetical protein